jgi:hypothetical protein
VLPANSLLETFCLGYKWNALLPHWIEWRSIGEEFDAAVDAMRIEGDIEPMFTFVAGTLGEPWDQRPKGMTQVRVLSRPPQLLESEIP